MYIYIPIKNTEVSQGIMEDLDTTDEKSSQQLNLSCIAPPLVWLSSVLCHRLSVPHFKFFEDLSPLLQSGEASRPRSSFCPGFRGTIIVGTPMPMYK